MRYLTSQYIATIMYSLVVQLIHYWKTFPRAGSIQNTATEVADLI